MKTVNIHEAKTHLSKLLARVAKGEHIVIARAGSPVAELRPCAPRRVPRQSGWAKDKIEIIGDFNAPLPDDVLDLFYGKGGDSTL